MHAHLYLWRPLTLIDKTGNVKMPHRRLREEKARVAQRQCYLILQDVPKKNPQVSNLTGPHLLPSRNRSSTIASQKILYRWHLPHLFFFHFCRQPAKHWGKISDSGKISGTWLPDDKHALQIQCRPLVDSLMRPGLMRSHNSAPSGTLSDWPTYAGLDNIPSRATWALQSTYIALIK